MRWSPLELRRIARLSILLLPFFDVPALAQPPRARAAELFEELWRASGAPGASVAIARDGEMLFTAGIGYAELENSVAATPATVYNIGSVSKVVTAVAVMQLVERGEVDLRDPIRKYVPSFPDKGEPITVWNLMTHTSGIRHYRPHDFPEGTEWDNVGTYDSFDEAIGIFADDPLQFAPGAYYGYTSYGVNLLQGVVEAASGEPFEDYLRRHVWRPAGMLSTRFDRPDRIVPGRARGYAIVDGDVVPYRPEENVTYKFASGGMLSTVGDLVRFGTALLSGRLLEPETVELMFTPQLGEDVLQVRGDAEPEPLRWKQALMWRIRTDDEGRDFVHGCGQVKGFNACVVIYVEEGLVAATADNADVFGFRPALRLVDVFRSESEPEKGGS